MNRQTIELSGIVRNLPDDTVKDGTMHELINLRLRDGALRPVGAKTNLTNTFDLQFVHSISDEMKAHIGKTGGYLSYTVYQNGSKISGPTLTTIPCSAEMRFASLVNTLMVSNNATKTLIIMVFNHDDNTYRIFDTILPEMPLITLEKLAKSTDDEEAIFYHDTGEAKTADILNEYMASNAAALYASRAQKGYFIGRHLVVFAWELFDGSIAGHTLPQYISVSELEMKVVLVEPATYPWSIGDSVHLWKKFTGYNLRYKVNISSDDLTELKSQYEGIIKSLNIYITRPPAIIPLLVTNAKNDDYFSVTDPNTADDIRAFFEGESALFLLKSIPLDQIIANTASTIIIGDTGKIIFNAGMKTEGLSTHTIFGESLFTYNSRIFLGSIQNTLSNPRSPDGLIGPGKDNTSGTAYDVAFVFDIGTENGTKTVVSDWYNCNYYNTTTGEFLFVIKNLIIGYPDARAKTLKIFVRDPSSNIRLVATLPLTVNASLNFAFTLALEYLDIYQGLPTFEGPFTDHPITAINENKVYDDFNRIQATELNNPFFFPAINSYRLTGKIIGMSCNAIALSSGQFGQFPIFVFTSEGIWTMNIGTGETLINTITPLSGEVCNNPRSIKPIDGGTVFTTSKALCIISGTKVLPISDLAEGGHTSKLSGILSYESFINNANICQIKDYLCSASFLNYISGANIAFDSGEDRKEIIISNSIYNYSWVYSLKSSLWFKIAESFKNLIHDYPLTYGTRKVTSNGLYYNWFAVTDSRNIAPAGWHVSSFDEIMGLYDYLGGWTVAGGKLKQKGLVNWESPNAGATNETGFDAIGSSFIEYAGYPRDDYYKREFWLWASTGGYPTAADAMVLSYLTPYGGWDQQTDKTRGLSVRLVKDDSNDPGEMTGNDGTKYPTVKIGSQVWMAENSRETMYRNGDPIPVVQDPETWEGLSTGACMPFNNFANIDVYSLHDITQEDFADPVPIHIETRPLKLSPGLFKKLQRMLVHGYIPDQSKPLSIQLFGSTDKIRWHLHGNGRLFNNMSSFLIGRSAFSCRYFILVIGGEVGNQFNLTYLDADYEDRYADKLR